MNQNSYAFDVLCYVVSNPGCTGAQVAAAIGYDHPLYGRHHAVSQALVSLRKGGYLNDCARCAHCGGATSRGQRNVPLVPTQKAQELFVFESLEPTCQAIQTA